MTAMSNITSLKKLCNHPDFVFEKIAKRAGGFEKALQLMPLSTA
jgi:DNA repair and recombination protein RAD54 and RAD54-like protein